MTINCFCVASHIHNRHLSHVAACIYRLNAPAGSVGSINEEATHSNRLRTVRAVVSVLREYECILIAMLKTSQGGGGTAMRSYPARARSMRFVGEGGRGKVMMVGRKGGCQAHPKSTPGSEGSYADKNKAQAQKKGTVRMVSVGAEWRADKPTKADTRFVKGEGS